MHKLLAGLVGLLVSGSAAYAQVQPSAPVASKGYVDTQLGTKLPLAGGALTGGLSCAPGVTCDVSPLSVKPGGALSSRILSDIIGDIIRPKAFGAICDGASHPLSARFGTLAAAKAVYPHATALTNEQDWAALQAAANRVASIGGTVAFPSNATCLIDQPIVAKPLNAVATPAYGLQYAAFLTTSFVSDGTTILRATATMPAMLQLTFNTGIGSGGYFSTIRGLNFDGNNLAAIGFDQQYVQGLWIGYNRFVNFPAGIAINSFGQSFHRIEHNTMKANIGIKTAQGGDSLYFQNDLYPTGANPVGMYCSYYCGNMDISTNTFNIDAGNTTGPVTAIAIHQEDAPNATEEVRHLVIRSNEFAGMTNALTATKNAANRKVFDIGMFNNHTSVIGSNNVGQLANLNGVDEFIAQGNWINGTGFATSTGAYGFSLTDVRRYQIRNNTMVNHNGIFATITDGSDGEISGNTIGDVGKAGASGSIISFANTNGPSANNVVSGNHATQSSSSYAQTFVTEGAGVTGTRVQFNTLSGIATPATMTSGTSSFLDVGASPAGQVGAVGFRTSAGNALTLLNPPSGAAANYPQFQSAAAGGVVSLTAAGSDANIWWNWYTKGTGLHQFLSGGGLGFQVNAVTSSANYGRFTSAAAGAAPSLAALGSDANIALGLLGKGTSGALTGVFARTADPTTADIPSGQCADWNNTTAATFKRVCNFGGTLRSATMN